MDNSFVFNLATNESEASGTERRGNLVLKGHTEFYPAEGDYDALYMIYIEVPDETINFASNATGSDEPASMTVVYNASQNPNLIAIRFTGHGSSE